MISEIWIKGFKRFLDQKVEMASLTVLTGLNGAGKTSLIHALLLIHKTSSANTTTVSLNNPPELELGIADGVRNWSTEGSIEFQLLSGNANAAARWVYDVPSESDAFYLNIVERPTPEKNPIALSSRGFTYLCAERLGPRSLLATSPVSPEMLQVGLHGEYCAQVLSSLGGKPIRFEDRIHPANTNAGPSLLKYEVERWLSEITTPIEVETVDFPGSAVAGLQFRVPGGDWVRAPNMGFGVSYALPIVLAGLIAEPDSLLVIENPEAHLHPAGQSRMGNFLTWLASRGVQVVVETHSDHVLNGIRRGVAENGHLEHEKVLVNFFSSNEDHGLAVEPLRMNSSGGISSWPKGFFDQYQIDVSVLGRLRRRN